MLFEIFIFELNKQLVGNLNNLVDVDVFSYVLHMF